ncbi:VWA domain-containing protein [Amycolatopsis vancoresmycina]|nr:VWA domain-containing protein [Amycolatopsis vancoresmycina]
MSGRTGALPMAAAVLALTLLLLSSGTWSGASATPMPRVAEQQGVGIKPVRMVILVDESGSISAQDMAREQDAASLISQAELSPNSTVSVVGFASDSGSKPAVDVVCPPLTLAGPAERERIAQCVGELRKRTTEEGAGTDHAEALKQALSYLDQGSSPDEQKMIFLLTDGVLDVGDSPRYGVGKTAQQRNAAAHEVIRENLVKARDAHVQIWPLGFGNVDKSALDEFAQGGFQNGCGPGVPQPSATVVSGSADVAAALLRSFSSGSCTGTGPVTQNQLGSGAGLDVPVTVPAIATDGSIVVVKHDGRVAVEYVDPQGTVVPKSGKTASGQFSVSGESGAVEVLHVVDPLPGTWHVRLTSLPDIPPQNVLTTVTWRGAAQAQLLVDPPSPAAGQEVTVSLQVVLRGGRPVTDPNLLQGLNFGVAMESPKLPAQQLTLRDDGQGPDSAPDGTYSGRTTIPAAAAGQVTFHGTVSGIGISAADALAAVRVAPGVPVVLATTTLPTIATKVAPGQSAAAQVSVTNNSGQRRRLRIEVRTTGHAAITVPDAVHDADPGISNFGFQLVVAGNSADGVTTGTVRLVDDADPATVYHERAFTLDVERPGPPFPWLPVLGGLALALILLAAVAAVVARRRTQEVKDLTVQAVRNGHRTYLHAEDHNAVLFPFVVSTQTRVPELHHTKPGDPDAFLLTRSRAGLRIRTPYGETRQAQLDEEVEVGDGLTLVVTQPLIRAGDDGDDPGDDYAATASGPDAVAPGDPLL